MREIEVEEREFFKELETKGLKPHQVEGVKWMAAMYDCGCNCILGDEMGMGKTLQAITLIMRNMLRARVSSDPVLIICPLAVLKGWEEVFNKWVSKEDISLFIYHGDGRANTWKEKSSVVVLTTPGMLISDFEEINAHGGRWGLVVVDEAHNAKNSASIFSRHLESLDTESFLLLTGTIIHNNIEEELAHMLGFVIPPVAREAVLACVLEKPKDGLFVGARPSASLEIVARILYCFMLRRLIQDTPGVTMPSKISCTVYLPQTSLQEKLYKRGCNASLCDKHPFLTLADDVEDSGHTSITPELIAAVVDNSYKMKFIVDILPILLKREADNKHKVLIFSNSLGVLYLLLGVTSEKGYWSDMITGEVNDITERKQRLDRFNAGNGPDIMLLSTKAMGQGVQLTGADTVIFYDHHDNPQNDNQAEARAYRITQRKPVLVLRLVTKFTSEAEAMSSRVKRKREIQQWMEFTRATVIGKPSNPVVKAQLEHCRRSLS